MTPERWGQLEELYQAARALPPSKRTALLERADPELRATVASILAQEGVLEKGDASQEDGAFLDRPAWEGRESLLKHDGPLQAETPVSVGEQLGPYRIEQEIGHGGMGTVYRATDTRLGRPVAIKISRSLFDERFEREARAISSLNHPHICTLHDVGPGYMVMELVEGETMAARIRKGALPIGDVLRYGAQIAGALAAAHEKNTTHRDLKPANVMIAKNGVKVLDFGLAKCSTRDGTITRSGAVMGTPVYMAPEQLEGKEADTRSDIFALGHTLYEMATAKRLVPGQPPAMEGLPQRFTHVVERCLEVEPEKRWQSARDVKAELEWAADREPSNRWHTAAGSGTRPGVSIPGAGASVLPPKRTWLRKMIGPLLAVALTAVLAIGTAMFWRSAPASEPPLQAVPLTSFPGNADTATFSPDGSQVAFAWDGEKEQDLAAITDADIYVQLVGSGSRPLRLTNNPMTDRRPTWSPDGRSIAFTRVERDVNREGSAVAVAPAMAPRRAQMALLVSPLGGIEREVAKLGLGLDYFVGLAKLWGLDQNGVSGWSPDGRWLVSSEEVSADNPTAIYLYSVEGSEKRRLTSPPAGTPGDTNGVISPDGRKLAFIRVAVNTVGWMASDVYCLSLGADYSPQGEPKRLTSDKAQLVGIAWTANSREIVFSSNRGGSLALWRTAVSASASPRPLLLSNGENATWPAISRQGNRLLYAQRSGPVFNLRRVNLSDPSQAPTVLIPSIGVELSAQYSPDGKRIVFASNRASVRDEIWVCDADGANPSKLFTTQLSQSGYSGSPQWSHDGQWIAFDSEIDGHWQIFTASAKGGKPRQITKDWSNSRPNWSHDGRWIYFTSQRSGRQGIWRIPTGAGEPEQVTKSGGRNVVESGDGKSIWYDNDRSIWNARTDGSGAVRVVNGPVALVGFALTDKGIYYYSRGPHEVLQFFSFATGKSRALLTPDKPPNIGLSVSPDGHWLIYSQMDREAASNLMLVDNFH